MLDVTEAGRKQFNLTHQQKNEVHPLLATEKDSLDASTHSSTKFEVLQPEDDSESSRKFYYFENFFLLALVFPFEIVGYACFGLNAPYNYLAIPKFARILYFNRYWYVHTYERVDVSNSLFFVYQVSIAPFPGEEHAVKELHRS